MDIRSREGPPDAGVVLFNKGGRDFRIERMSQGREVPREFFYGYFDLLQAGIPAAMMSSAGAMPGLCGRIADVAERGFARFTEVGVRPLSMRLAAPALAGTRVAISFTDGFSLSLGFGYPKRTGGPVLIGGFHGFSDIELRAKKSMRGLARSLIARALAGLDHAFFFGPADRDVAIKRYGLTAERSSIFPFGIDTEFWRPLPDTVKQDFVLAVGQDHNRDYDLLASAPGRHPTRIMTRLSVKIPDGADHVEVLPGGYFGSESMSDETLRRWYNQAAAVIVPLRDVYQPSGYSVTLQAMSCGKPVVLSNIRGLWAPKLLRNGENCLLVPPGDAAALGAAIESIRSDAALADRLGRAARETAVRSFGLDRMASGTIALAKLGLSLHGRSRHVA